MEILREYKPFDIVVIENVNSNNGSCQGGKRPYVVCQNEVGCKYSPTLIVMPLTTKIKKQSQPTHEIIRRGEDNKLLKDSMILGEQVSTVDKQFVGKKIGHISNEEDQNRVYKCFIANIFGKSVNLENVEHAKTICYA